MERFLANVAINLAVGLQWASLLFIPAIYGAISEDRLFTIEQDGLLLTTRLIAMFCWLPFYGWLAYLVPRNVVLVVSLLASAICTFINLTCNTYASFMVFNIANGIALGAVIPVGRSLIPAYYPLEERGRYFGYLEMSSGIGGFVGSGVATLITAGTGVHWRTVYLVMGLLHIPVLTLVQLWVKDPIFEERNRVKSRDELLEIYPGMEDEGVNFPSRNDFRELFSNPVYLTILGQGLGAFPWSGNSFLILWFQRMGISESLSLLIFASVGIGAALGGLIGGVLGDRISSRNTCGLGRKYGRIFVSHISVLAGIPFISVLTMAIPRLKEFWWCYALIGLFMGLTIAWPPANNSAIVSDIFPRRLHAIAYAVQYWIEGTVAAFCPYLVGYLNNEVFGGQDLTPPGGVNEWNSFAPPRQRAALDAMGMSLMLVGVIPWGVAQLFYIPMYRFYPRCSISLQKAGDEVVF